jgi:hypothetical protein
MAPPCRAAALALMGIVAPIAVSAAQARPRLEVRIPSAAAADPVPDTTASPAAAGGTAIGTGGAPPVAHPGPPASPPPPTPTVSGIDLLADGKTRDLMRNGFPARLHFRLELWTTGGLFNKLEGTREWDVVVRFEPLTKHYMAGRIAEDRVTLLGDFERLPDLVTAVAAPYAVPLLPQRRGQRYYYNAVVDIEMLSLRDLDEVEHWLRGDLQPAIHGQRGAGTAMTNGLRTLFLRLIGAERRHYEARSKTFTAP